MSELVYTVGEVFDARSGPGCLRQYGCKAFMIPSYQRGYKWGSEDDQPVAKLLSDLSRAFLNGGKEYLLQAITVKKIASRGQLEVIDGQQRLTTLAILLHVLASLSGGGPSLVEDRLLYDIRHEGTSFDTLIADWLRPIGDSGSFVALKKAHRPEEEPRQDGFYLKCAVLRCHAGLSAMRKDSKDGLDGFRAFLLDRVKLMVNAVEPHISGEIIFGNLNTNKVALTGTELVKGLLLTRVAREMRPTRGGHYREVMEARLHTGRKWDELTHWANQPEIRGQYFREYKDDGMRGLLELVALRMRAIPAFQPGGKDKGLFEFFLALPSLNQVFQLLADTHAVLEDWFSDRDTFHLLGFELVTRHKSDSRLRTLADHLAMGTKQEVTDSLRRLRRRTLLPDTDDGKESAINFDNLRYGQDNDRIEAVLLAMSIFREGNTDRFSFLRYQEERWSLEHVFPQNPFGKKAELNEKQRTLATLILSGRDILDPKTLTDLEALQQEGAPADGSTLEEKVVELLGRQPLIHGIGNMCLLTTRDNASLGCRMFTEKRNAIRTRIASGSFVPHHTYEVFSKMIMGGDERVDSWSNVDIAAHTEAINERIRKMLEESA
jgi:hypothetical protein